MLYYTRFSLSAHFLLLHINKMQIWDLLVFYLPRPHIGLPTPAVDEAATGKLRNLRRMSCPENFSTRSRCGHEKLWWRQGLQNGVPEN